MPPLKYLPSILSFQNDLYFSSTALLTASRADARRSLPEARLPKHIDKKAFSASTRLSMHEMTYVYKITASSLAGRRDSSVSVHSLQSDDNSPRPTSNSSVSDIPEHIETASTGSSTNLDLMTTIMPENSEYSPRGDAPSFFIDSSLSAGSGRKYRGGKVMILNDPLDSESLTYSPGSVGGGQLSVLDAISLESSVCSSPDSGVVQDDFSNSTTPQTASAFRVRTGVVTANGVHRSSVLRDEIPLHTSNS